MPIFGTSKAKTDVRYELIEKIGEGAMGMVWKAYDRKSKSNVALKILWDPANPIKMRFFQDECRKLKQVLAHPNIIDIHDADEMEVEGVRRPFLVMPLLKGQTLSELIESGRGRLAPDRLVEIIYQTCKGLEAAHERGIIHRDQAE